MGVGGVGTAHIIKHLTPSLALPLIGGGDLKAIMKTAAHTESLNHITINKTICHNLIKSGNPVYIHITTHRICTIL